MVDIAEEEMDIWSNKGYYKTIYADPPWEYADKKGHSAKLGAATSAYPTMSFNEIAKLPVNSIAHRDCTLLLWATMPQLQTALDVIGFWGFNYKTVAFVWVKLNPSGVGIYSGLGHWVNGNAELVLLANRGHPIRLRKDIKQIVMVARGSHSVKPEEARRRIELLFEGPRVELFARKQSVGWDVWGNEV